MAFVLVQHLAPDHESILADLVRRYTRMAVFEVEDGMPVEVNSAYIIPPNRDMTFQNGTLRLTEPRAPRGHRYPIDFFFRSLARDQRERAICVVLSGTGSDGTEGLRAIKSEGGMVVVQDPDSTEYDGMPRSAIGTGLVDIELPPNEMPSQLIAYAAHAFGDRGVRVKEAGSVSAMGKVFGLLRSQTGHDFSQYKPNTVRRRVERRMAVHQISKVEEYAAFMKRTAPEVDALLRDLLIGVTSFFRDSECFEMLEQQAIPRLFEGKPEGSTIRVWSAGCSTGEEAYSIAILLKEYLQRHECNYTIQVFATDIDSHAISAARAGIYPSNVAADVSSERISSFFSSEDDGATYRIHKSIRDLLIFSEQNVIKDPPFSKLDLVACRNLLIYMGAELQKRIIPCFHFALNPGGILFLGNSETVGEFDNLFSVVDRKSRIYTRKEHVRVMEHTSSRRTASSFPPANNATKREYAQSHSPKVRLREIAEQNLLRHLAPGAALVSGTGEVLYLHGRTGMYLEPSPGVVGITNILEMAREGLRRPLVDAIKRASVEQKSIEVRGLRVKSNGDFTSTDLTVCPVAASPGTILEAPVYLVILERSRVPASAIREKSSPAPSDKPESDSRFEELRRELREKEEYLQTTVEELEATNEELKSSNEEMQSVNEELQSLNEELETSKEELQSVNEELATVNTELQNKVAELSRVNNDMNNLLSGTGIGTVFVDRDLRILRFTPAATQIINLIYADIGRPVGHIASNLVSYDSLVQDAETVLSTLVPKEVEVQTLDRAWYTLRILPYRTLDDMIVGVVITFFNVTEMKHAQDTIEQLLQEKELLLKEVHHRIKNNMGTVMSLLSLQAERLSDRAAAVALQDAINRINTMAVLYDKFYRSEGFESVSLKTYLAPLIEDSLRNYPENTVIAVKGEVGDIFLDARHLFPLGILVNELLTNIMKYAFAGRDRGVITVSASSKERLVTLTVGDDGNGLPESINFENSTGFGILLVGMLTNAAFRRDPNRAREWNKIHS